MDTQAGNGFGYIAIQYHCTLEVYKQGPKVISLFHNFPPSLLLTSFSLVHLHS